MLRKIAVIPLVYRSSVSLTQWTTGPHRVYPASIVRVGEISCGAIVTASQPPSSGCILAIAVQGANKRFDKQQGEIRRLMPEKEL